MFSKNLKQESKLQGQESIVNVLNSVIHKKVINNSKSIEGVNLIAKHFHLST